MRGCITKKGSTYSIIVDIGRGENGKRKQKWFNGFKTKKAAEKELAKVIAQIESNTYIDITTKTVADYLEDWLNNYVDLNLSESAKYTYRMLIEKHVIPVVGSIQLQKLQPYHIQELYNQKMKNGRLDGKGGLSAKSVVYIHRVLKKSFSQAYKLQLLSRNVADLVEIPRKKAFQSTTLNDNDIDRFIKVFENTNIYIPVILSLSLGLRRGEALGLRWKDIDFDKRTITINQTINPKEKGYYFKAPKTESSRRTIVISDVLKSILLKHKERQANLQSTLGEAYNDYDLVSCREDGSPIHPSGFSQQFCRVLKNNNLPHIRFHDLRHTNATLMLKKNIPAKIASERLGHSTIGITLDLYSHVMKEMQEPVAEAIDEALFKN